MHRCLGSKINKFAQCCEKFDWMMCDFLTSFE